MDLNSDIQIVTPRGEFHYQVDATEIVDPNNIDVLRTEVYGDGTRCRPRRRMPA
jgi:hypothetical protein